MYLKPEEVPLNTLSCIIESQPFNFYFWNAYSSASVKKDKILGRKSGVRNLSMCRHKLSVKRLLDEREVTR
jgi:hypothetical protein